MRLCRFEHEGKASYGDVVRGGPHEGYIQPLVGDPFSRFEPRGQPVEQASVRLLAPVLPSKIVAVGRNYRAHAQELGNDVPKSPLLFLKPPSAILPTEMTVRLPPESQRVEHEAELGVVIGKLARNVSADDAAKFIFGYCCFNDVTARDLQREEIQFTRAKGFDTFAPLGPLVETAFDPRDVGIVCRVNGEIRQAGRTRDMVFDVPALVSFISHSMTLLPGDVIATGTPQGVGLLRDGDVVEVEIEGLGVLRNPVAAEAE